MVADFFGNKFTFCKKLTSIRSIYTSRQIREQITQQKKVFAASSTYHYASDLPPWDQDLEVPPVWVLCHFSPFHLWCVAGTNGISTHGGNDSGTPRSTGGWRWRYGAGWKRSNVQFLKGGLCWDTHSLLYLLVYVFYEPSVSMILASWFGGWGLRFRGTHCVRGEGWTTPSIPFQTRGN